MNKPLLRQFIQEALHDRQASMLRGIKPEYVDNSEAQRVAEEWSIDVGLDPDGSAQYKVVNFVSKRWDGLMERFRGNTLMVKQTVFNLLDTRYNQFTTGA